MGADSRNVALRMGATAAVSDDRHHPRRKLFRRRRRSGDSMSKFIVAVRRLPPHCASPRAGVAAAPRDPAASAQCSRRRISAMGADSRNVAFRMGATAAVSDDRHRPRRKLFRRWRSGDSMKEFMVAVRRLPPHHASPRAGVAAAPRDPAASAQCSRRRISAMGADSRNVALRMGAPAAVSDRAAPRDPAASPRPRTGAGSPPPRARPRSIPGWRAGRKRRRRRPAPPGRAVPGR